MDPFNHLKASSCVACIEHSSRRELSYSDRPCHAGLQHGTGDPSSCCQRRSWITFRCIWKTAKNCVMLKMMDLDDVTVEQCSRVMSSRWSFIFQVKVWPQVISSSSVVDNALKTCAANLRFFVLRALSTTDVICATLRLSQKWNPTLLRPLLTGVLQGMHLDGIPLSGCPRTVTCWLWILEPYLGQLRCTDSQSAVNGRSSAYFRTLQQKFASTNNKQLTGRKLACQLLVVCACIRCWAQKPVCLWSQARRRHWPFFFGVAAVHVWMFVASVNWSNANSFQGIWLEDSIIQMPCKELALLSLHAKDVFCFRVGQCFEDVEFFFVFKALSST